MSLSKEAKPALVLIDIQKGFADIAYWGGRRYPAELIQETALAGLR